MESQIELAVVPFKGWQLPETLQRQIEQANLELNWTVAQTQADFANEHAEYYVMLAKDDVQGYVALHHILDEVTFNMVYVDPNLRGQGVGTALLAFVLDQLRAREVQHIFLEVRAQNQVAQRLYQSAGFETLIIRPNYYQHPQDDAVIMQLKLSNEQ